MTKANVMRVCLGMAVAVLWINSSSVIASGGKECSLSVNPEKCGAGSAAARSSGTVTLDAQAERTGGAITSLLVIADAVKTQCHTVSLQYLNGKTETNAAGLHSCLQTQRGSNTVSMCSLLFVAANDACKGVHGGLFDSDNDECQASFIESTNAFPVWAGEEGYCGWY